MTLKPRSEKKSTRAPRTLRKLSEREMAAVSGAGLGSGAAAGVRHGDLVVVKHVDQASAKLFL